MLVRDENGKIISMPENHNRFAVHRPKSGVLNRPESFPDLHLPIPVRLPKQPVLHPRQMPKKPMPHIPPSRNFPVTGKYQPPNVRFEDADVRFETSK